MASAFEHFGGIYDVAFKARHLNSLITECVPDENHSIKNYSNIERLLVEIKKHKLLSEKVEDGYKADKKSVERWKQAVDLWIDKLLALLSSNALDKLWFGISFLGVTLQACDFERFKASYALWFQKLLPLLQSAGSNLVKAALCSSISDLLTRLGFSDFPDGKREGFSFAGKLVQPVLKMLGENCSEDALDGAVRLICTLVTFFPSSIHRHNDTIEAFIVTKLVSQKCTDKLVRNLAHCLAVLPKSKGDESSWSLMVHRLLVEINLHLNNAFQGLEEESIGKEAVRALVPPGKERPTPLGGHTVSGADAGLVSMKSEGFGMSWVSTLVLCCLEMLSSPYPVQVTVPICDVIALVRRILMLDGNLSKSPFPFKTAMQQEYICTQLPILHEYSLELLTALMKVSRSQLLPHSPMVVQLLEAYFSRCALPELRMKIYSILQTMLDSMGAGLALHISADIIKNVIADLKPLLSGAEGRVSHTLKTVQKELPLAPCNRKRKKSARTEPLEQQHNEVSLEMKALSSASLSVMIAALKALEALLLAGCTSKDGSLRADVDSLLIAVANNACKGGWAKEEIHINLANVHLPTWAEFQYASLEALKASFLSSARVRPPYLARGLELFNRGKLEMGTKTAKICADALQSLEVLIHPRARSVADFRLAESSLAANNDQKPFENIYSVYQRGNIPSSIGVMGMGLDEPDPDEDDLYRSWLEKEEEADMPLTDSSKQEDAKQASQTVEYPEPQNPHNVSDVTHLLPDGTQAAMTLDVGPEKTMGNTDEVMFEPQRQEPESDIRPTSAPDVISSVGATEITNQLTGNDAPFPEMGSLTSAPSTDQGLHSTSPIAPRTKLFEVFKIDNMEADMDSYPDIVDADPDSDSESD